MRYNYCRRHLPQDDCCPNYSSTDARFAHRRVIQNFPEAGTRPGLSRISTAYVCAAMQRN